MTDDAAAREQRYARLRARWEEATKPPSEANPRPSEKQADPRPHRRNDPWPSRHETAVLRRIAAGHLRVEIRNDQPAPVFVYDDGTVILTADSVALD
jgi:hypothetical protein